MDGERPNSVYSLENPPTILSHLQTVGGEGRCIYEWSYYQRSSRAPLIVHCGIWCHTIERKEEKEGSLVQVTRLTYTPSLDDMRQGERGMVLFFLSSDAEQITTGSEGGTRPIKSREDIWEDDVPAPGGSDVLECGQADERIDEGDTASAVPVCGRVQPRRVGSTIHVLLADGEKREPNVGGTRKTVLPPVWTQDVDKDGARTPNNTTGTWENFGALTSKTEGRCGLGGGDQTRRGREQRRTGRDVACSVCGL
ncbi:hypothetical protein E2C01_037774 [Portunus trituberculatus]|uniref:Uncharacterized protein n=1 Tax=Portunus trituberculatus TaxID=210409 RepID=A0A5B7F902_PORTR|nr:hypothetical protein [Portunus trituberculatus]